jgi:hypothetical protein
LFLRKFIVRQQIYDIDSVSLRFDTSGFEERQGHWWVAHRLLRHGTKACAAHEGPHDSPVRETRAADDPIDLLVELRVDGHAVILLVLDIANEGVESFLRAVCARRRSALKIASRASLGKGEGKDKEEGGRRRGE